MAQPDADDAGAAAREDDALLSRSLHLARDAALSVDHVQSKCALPRNATGNLRELTRDVSKDAAMLIYLDGANNVAAHPNENYARELMELFTLGVDNYTENDVRESARAWTGWRVDRKMIAFGSIRAFTTAAARRFSDASVTSMATISSTSSSTNRSARDSLQRASSTGLSTTIPNRRSSMRVAGYRAHDFELAPVVDRSCERRLLQRASLSCAGEESGRVRRRHATKRWVLPRSTRRHCRRSADGPAAFLSPQRRGMAGRPELADERHDDRAAELSDAPARIADARRIFVAAQLTVKPQNAAERAATILARRRRAGIALRARSIS